jgi:hypothetical protein
MSNAPLQPLNPKDQALLKHLMAQALLELMLSEPHQPVDPPDVLEAYNRLGYFPATELERWIAQFPFEGPEHYLSQLLAQVDTQTNWLHRACFALLEESTKPEALAAWRQVNEVRFWLLDLFLNHRPNPPFEGIRHLLPVRTDIVTVVGDQPQHSHLKDYLMALVTQPPLIEAYLHQDPSPVPRNPLLRFIVNRCQRRKQKRFRQAVYRLITATDNLRGYLFSYLQPHRQDQQMRREYELYPPRSTDLDR